jgi:hypothetical protein
VKKTPLQSSFEVMAAVCLICVVLSLADDNMVATIIGTIATIVCWIAAGVIDDN